MRLSPDFPGATRNQPVTSPVDGSLGRVSQGEPPVTPVQPSEETGSRR